MTFDVLGVAARQMRELHSSATGLMTVMSGGEEPASTPRLHRRPTPLSSQPNARTAQATANRAPTANRRVPIIRFLCAIMFAHPVRVKKCSAHPYLGLGAASDEVGAASHAR